MPPQEGQQVRSKDSGAWGEVIAVLDADLARQLAGDEAEGRTLCRVWLTFGSLQPLSVLKYADELVYE